MAQSTRCGRRTTRGTPPTRCASSPAPEAVAGITRVDEPVGDLLDRFEQASIDEVLAAGAEPVRRGVAQAGPCRRHRPAGRRARLARRAVGGPRPRSTRCTASASPASGRSARTGSPTHPSTGARLELAGEHVDAERAAVRHLDHHPVHAAGVHGRRRHARGHHRGRVRRDAGGAGHRRQRRRPRGAVRRSPTAAPRSPCRWDPEEVADHTGVTATFGAAARARADAGARRTRRPLLARRVRGHRLGAHRRRLPGRRGSARAWSTSTTPRTCSPRCRRRKAELTVTATASAAVDTEVGRVVPVSVTIADADGRPGRHARGARSRSAAAPARSS